MNINANNALKKLIFIIAVMLAGIIITVGVTEFALYSTRETRHKLNPPGGDVDVSKLPDSPYKMPEKTVPQATSAQKIPEGFMPPVDKNTPLPINSKKANNTLDNLLFAMSFYYRIPVEDEMESSVVGWDVETGYYLPDKSAPIMSLARNVRYLLILKLYQKLYPTTKYFDNDAARIESIARRQLDPKNLDSMLTNAITILRFIPNKLLYDLLDLSKITGDNLYRTSALKVGEKLSIPVVVQTGLIKSNRDRTDKVGMFGDAASGYITGKEMGKLDLTEDAQILMDELMKELWAEKFNLFYTNSAIGQFGNITETFITTNQMHALGNIVRFAEASQDKTLAEKAQKILTSMADGSNVICDTKHFGFFRRYNGKSQTPHEDYKLSEDHIAYLEAWIRLNMMFDGQFEKILNTEYDGFEMFLYNDYTNCIFLSYEMDWKPHLEENGKPIASVDAILDYLLMTLQDREFVGKKAAGS